MPYNAPVATPWKINLPGRPTVGWSHLGYPRILLGKILRTPGLPGNFDLGEIWPTLGLPYDFLLQGR